MSWEDRQPSAVMHRAREAKRRARDAGVPSIPPNAAGFRISNEWQRPVVREPSPDMLLNRQERILTEIRDALTAKPKTKRGKR